MIYQENTELLRIQTEINELLKRDIGYLYTFDRDYYSDLINKRDNLIKELQKQKGVEWLKCIYDGAKSFYKKAYTIKIDNIELLFSYNTHVLTLYNNNTYELNHNIDDELLFSQTTKRHILEFLKQHGITLDNYRGTFKERIIAGERW